MFETFGGALGFLNIAAGVFGSVRGIEVSREQEGYYMRQAEINRQIGQFNYEVSMRQGKESVDAIATATRRLLGEQRASFAGRGIDLEGSPMMILGETLTMGSKQAQEAYFNAEVQATNALYNMNSEVMKSENAASQAKYEGLSNTVNLAKQLVGVKTNIDIYNASVGKSSAAESNIFEIVKRGGGTFTIG